MAKSINCYGVIWREVLLWLSNLAKLQESLLYQWIWPIYCCIYKTNQESLVILYVNRATLWIKSRAQSKH